MVDKIGAGQPNKISQYEIDQIAATLRREIDKMLGKGNPTDVAILDAVKKNPIFGTDKIPEADLHKLIAQARDDKVDDEAIKEAGKRKLWNSNTVYHQWDTILHKIDPDYKKIDVIKLLKEKHGEHYYE